MEDAMEKHIGKNIRAIRQLRGMKQEIFARKLGIKQQNVSKMENKKSPSEEQIEAAAKILQTSTEAIKNFDENGIFQNNLFNEQVNNFNPVEKVVELYERLLKEAKDEISVLKNELEEYRKNKRKPTKQKEAKLKSMPGKQAVQ
jgi:transcriptional regulator with XRE-family HTH domain